MANVDFDMIASIRSLMDHLTSARPVALGICAAAFVCLAAAPSRSVREGVYSKAQVARGQTVYREECAKCHAENLGGGEGAPGLVGPEFLMKWQGKSVGDLFELTRKTMPADDPGNLSRRQYADITAYVLSVNELPAGEKDLEPTPEALNDIRIEAKK